jgi:hypothetical protein
VRSGLGAALQLVADAVDELRSRVAAGRMERVSTQSFEDLCVLVKELAERVRELEERTREQLHCPEEGW